MDCIWDIYLQKCKTGELTPDPKQEQAVILLKKLEKNLSLFRLSQQKGLLLSFMQKPTPPPKGIYFYGGVGRGKSMLMDLFYQHICDKIPSKRIHFHEFMIGVHEQLNLLRQEQTIDPLSKVAEQIAHQYQLLCFDEFFVQDITDAMILGQLFSALFKRGVILVVTSNIPIEDLYKNGLQRSQFLPFIALFKENMISYFLDSPIDYRQISMNNFKRYFQQNERQQFLEAYNIQTKHMLKTPLKITVYGRDILFPEHHRGIVYTDFSTLCKTPLAAADYVKLSKQLHVLFLDYIPDLSGGEQDDYLRRFLYLIDCLYDEKRQLFLQLNTTLEKIYCSGKYTFEFSRALSRLNQMQSEDWIR